MLQQALRGNDRPGEKQVAHPTEEDHNAWLASVAKTQRGWIFSVDNVFFSA